MTDEEKAKYSLKPYSEQHWSDLFRPLLTGKNVIVAGDTVASALPTARLLQKLGSATPFILGTQGQGTGEMPGDTDGEWLALDTPLAENLVASIHSSQATLANLPQHAVAAIDKYDPNHNALVVASHFNESSEIAGRKALAYRKPEWLALEDKMVADEIWDIAGVVHEPFEIVRVDKDAINEAVEHINKGYGTVWSGDSREGFSGGAEGTRWVRTAADADDAFAYFSKHCDKLRVMPFLEGIPCSIHGIVFPDYSAALRPVELVVLRRPNSNEFFYAGTATYWDPAPSDRVDMRSIAKRVGNTLRELVDYRGIFTVDGVMTRDGFRPTELNPRSGAGIKPMLNGLPALPLQLIADALTANIDLDYRPKNLEALIIGAADKQRGGGTWRAIPHTIRPIDKCSVVYGDGEWCWSDGEDYDGTITIGPGPLGSFVSLAPDSKKINVGRSFAPAACDFWRFIDQKFDANIGLLESAKPVR